MAETEPEIQEIRKSLLGWGGILQHCRVLKQIKGEGALGSGSALREGVPSTRRAPPVERSGEARLRIGEPEWGRAMRRMNASSARCTSWSNREIGRGYGWIELSGWMVTVRLAVPAFSDEITTVTLTGRVASIASSAQDTSLT